MGPLVPEVGRHCGARGGEVAPAWRRRRLRPVVSSGEPRRGAPKSSLGDSRLDHRGDHRAADLACDRRPAVPRASVSWRRIATTASGSCTTWRQVNLSTRQPAATRAASRRRSSSNARRSPCVSHPSASTANRSEGQLKSTSQPSPETAIQALTSGRDIPAAPKSASARRSSSPLVHSHSTGRHAAPAAGRDPRASAACERAARRSRRGRAARVARPWPAPPEASPGPWRRGRAALAERSRRELHRRPPDQSGPGFQTPDTPRPAVG